MTSHALDSHGLPPIAESVAPRPRIMVVLHGRRAPTGAIALGRLLASALGAPLHGIFVWATPIPTSEVPKLLRLDPALLEGIVLDVEVGDPAERIAAITRAQPVAFVVLPAEDDGTDVCRLGDLASRTLAESTAGVILVRPDVRLERVARILLPLDGTPSTAACIGPAGELARQLGASIDILLVGQSHLPELHEPGAMSSPQYVDQPQHEWAAFSDEFLNRFLGAIGHVPMDLPVRFYLGAGNPASEILRFAEQLASDLIALVWHGELDQHAAVFRGVLRASDRPILVLRR